VSYPGVKEAIESSDFVINTGPFLSDSNSGGFTRSIKPENVVEIYSDYVVFKGQKFSDIAMKSRPSPLETPINPLVLTNLIKKISKDKLPKVTKPTLPPRPTPKDADSEQIVQSWIWNR